MQHEVHFITLKEVNLLLVAARTSAGKTSVTEYAFAMAAKHYWIGFTEKKKIQVLVCLCWSIRP